MNIARLNEIFTTRGSAVALQTARVAQMDDWIIKKLEAGQWEPGKKAEPKTAAKVIQLPISRPAPRVGKTARSGGLTASLQRKKAKSAADRELRNKMRSPGK
jgi:hypothetical protein